MNKGKKSSERFISQFGLQHVYIINYKSKYIIEMLMFKVNKGKMVVSHTENFVTH